MTAGELKAWMTLECWSVRSLAIYLGRNPATVQKWRKGTLPIPRYVELITKETK